MQERELRKLSIVIRGLERSGQPVSVDVHNFLSSNFGVTEGITDIREAGKGKTKTILVKFASFETKQEILRTKNKLKGSNTYIDPSMTKLQQEIYSHIKLQAKPLRDKGHDVKIRYTKMCVDGKWMFWNHVSKSLVVQDQQNPSPKRVAKSPRTHQKN